MPTRIEKDEKSGKYVAVVSLPGRQDQRYYGESHEELVTKLLRAQESATVTIDRQKLMLKTTAAGRPDGERTEVQLKPKPLTASERAALAEQLNDPQRADAALKVAIEAEVGASVEEIKKALGPEAQLNAERRRGEAEAEIFLARYPDYHRSPANEARMLGYLESRGWGVTARNLALAYEDLIASGSLEVRPSTNGNRPTEEPHENPPQPVTRPRLASTGMPAGRAPSAGARPRAVKLTDEELNKLPFDEYKRLYNDPSFRAARPDLFKAPERANP